MSIKSILLKISAFSKSLHNDLSSLLHGDMKGLPSSQLYAIAITACYSLRNELLLNTFKKQAKLYVDEINFELVKKSLVVAAELSAYVNSGIEHLYKAEFKHLFSKCKLDKAEVLTNMFAIAICINSKHMANFILKECEKSGVDESTIKTILKVLSIIKAANEVLMTDSLRNYEFIARDENM